MRYNNNRSSNNIANDPSSVREALISPLCFSVVCPYLQVDMLSISTALIQSAPPQEL